MNIFYQPLVAEGANYLDADESKHAMRVLRHRIGDVIYVTNGRGTLYEARIISLEDGRCAFNVINETTRDDTMRVHLQIAISPLSHPDRLEWFVEKAVELGADRITLIECERTGKKRMKSDRLQKIAVGAMKQSQRLVLPEIEGPVPYANFIASCAAEQKFIAFVDAANPLHLFHAAKKGGGYCVAIGPEGDFTGRELELALDAGFVKVSLGDYRLRTETAGIAACHTLNLLNLSSSL